MGTEGDKERGTIFRDIRRYYCDYCGICRSKKSLIFSHILTHHQEEIKKKKLNEEEENGNALNICEECGVSFTKPAYLKQHMLSHSTQRAFTCPLDDCHSSYKRKDHLTRHMLQHQGKLFVCPIEGCKSEFAYQGNMTRHVKEFHDESSASANVEHPKEYVCSEYGCGKVFKYLSKLCKHEKSHAIEAKCQEPGCMKYFTNKKCLKEHKLSCHQYIVCDKCGTKQLKKNIKRHMRTHEECVPPTRIKCSYEECLLSFSTKSNLNQHIKAVHSELRPYTCGISGCHMQFAFKHVRDNHEKSGCHFTPGDFEESDEEFSSRPRGGRKRTFPGIETLLRKRVCPPSEFYLWPHSSESEG